MTKSWTTNLTVFTYSAYDFDGHVRPERAIPALQDAAKGALPEHVENLEAGGEVVPGKHDKVANVRVPTVGHRMTVRSVEIGRPESGRDDAVDVGLGEGLGEGRGQGSKNLQGEAGGGGAKLAARGKLEFQHVGIKVSFLARKQKDGDYMYQVDM